MRELSGKTSLSSPLYLRPVEPNIDTENSKYTLELTNYGLSTTQARIYLFLLRKRGAVSVREISNDLGLHRVDVYRKLGELKELGAVEVYLDSPRKFSALEPGLVISGLVNKMEKRVDSLQDYGEKLGKMLTHYSQTQSIASKNNTSNAQDEGTTYKVVAGREPFYKEMHKIVKEAKQEVLRIVSPNGLVRTFLPTGLYKEYVRARERGVSIRMISEINNNNFSYAKRLSKILDIRSLSNVNLRFIVADKSITIMSTRFEENNMSPRAAGDSYLLFADRQFAKASCFIFDHLWDVSKPWEEVEDNYKNREIM